MNYTLNMKWEWDEVKSDACYRERGFDFAYAALAFADPNRIAQQDTRYIYGEDRYQLIGQIDGRLFVLVYTRVVTWFESSRLVKPTRVR